VTDTPRSDGQPEAVRLSVNVSREAADALKKIADDHGWSVTETVRRLIALGKFVYDEDQAGHRMLFHDGKRLREMELLP
jgi:hypothetical protein